MASTVQPAPAAKQSHISVERYFEISLLLMLATGFFTVAATGKLDFVSIVVVSAALALKLWSYSREKEFSISPRTVKHLSIFYLLFFALDFLIFAPGPSALDRMLQATVHMVLFTAVIKAFSARKNLDYAYLATLSFAMMLAAAILTVDTFYLICFTLYVLFSISTFISYEIKRSAEAAYATPEGPFAAPGRNRSAIESALMSVTLGLAVAIVALASVLFFVIPRFRTGYLTGLGANRQNITGFSETVNLGDLGKILQSNAVVMRVLPQGDPRDFQGVHWRGISLTSFDGRHWYNDNTAQSVVAPAYVTAGHERHYQLPPAPGAPAAMRRPLQYRLLLQPISTDVLFAAAVPRRLTTRLRMVNVDETGSLHNPLHSNSPISYDVVSDVGLPPVSALRGASAVLPSEIRLTYLRVPEKLDPRIAELARRITAGAGDNYDRAEMIRNYLRSHYGYSLHPPEIEPLHPLASFLFRAKKGYCEYFASAMAVMLRTLKVPARLVNGFRTGTYNRVGKDFVVRARDAHSWVEVYFPGYGWIPFDPTPPDPNVVAAGSWGPLEDYLDAINLFWNEWVINYDFIHQVQLARQFDQRARSMQARYRDRMREARYGAIRWAYRVEGWMMTHKALVFLIMTGVFIVLLVEGRGLSIEEMRFLWAWRFRQGDLKLGPREASLVYQRFLGIMARKGFRKPPAQTPREFAERFAGSGLNRPVAEFTGFYNAFRYGRAAVSLPRLRQILEQLKKA